MCKDIWRFLDILQKWLYLCPKQYKKKGCGGVMPIINKEAKLVNVCALCPYGKRSLERWVAAYKKGGETTLMPKSTSPKTSPYETPLQIKELIITKRKKLRFCAQKLHWHFLREGMSVPARTIGKILKQEGLTRKYRRKRVKYKYIRAERQPGELFEIDVKYVPGKLVNKRYFQYY